MDKQCFKCNKIKSIDEFYLHPQMGDGHLGKCKACACRDASVRAHELAGDPKWVAKERARNRKKQARYRQLGIAAKTTTEARRRWMIRNKEKVKAHQISSRALKKGLIRKSKSCNRCGAIGVKIEKHHADYSKPLAVEWLCVPCHGKTRHKSSYEDVPVP
jgi:hypothetical protein